MRIFVGSKASLDFWASIMLPFLFLTRATNRQSWSCLIGYSILCLFFLNHSLIHRSKSFQIKFAFKISVWKVMYLCPYILILQGTIEGLLISSGGLVGCRPRQWSSAHWFWQGAPMSSGAARNAILWITVLKQKKEQGCFSLHWLINDCRELDV